MCLHAGLLCRAHAVAFVSMSHGVAFVSMSHGVAFVSMSQLYVSGPDFAACIAALQDAGCNTDTRETA